MYAGRDMRYEVCGMTWYEQRSVISGMGQVACGMHALCDMCFVRYVVRAMRYEYVKCGTSFLVQGMRYEEGTGKQYEVCGTR